MATILVVDDEPDIRYLIQLNLELDGHRVMTAANGREALAAIGVEVPDLVVLDVMMPEIDGWLVLEQLKADADDRVASVKVIMLTALGADDDRLRGGIEGAVRYLVKPVSPDDLRRAVDDTLGGGPEREQRRVAQTAALTELARLEGGGVSHVGSGPRPRLAGLEHRRPRPAQGRVEPRVLSEHDELTDKQRELLARLVDAPSVVEAAESLGVSRSNVYASLRRVSRKLGVDSVPELLRQLRSGLIVVSE